MIIDKQPHKIIRYDMPRLRSANTRDTELPEPVDLDRNMVAGRKPFTKFALVCFVFTVMVISGSVINGTVVASNIPYQILMFIICFAPFFFMGVIPRHRLLTLFLACYYLIFVMSSFFDVVFGIEVGSTLGARLKYQIERGFFSKSDLVVIAGAVSFLAGYLVYDKIRGRRPSKILARDWKPAAVLKIALVAWALGLVFSIAYYLNVSPTRIPTHVLGIPLGIASNLRLFTPLAAIMLIYLIARGDYKLKLIWVIFIVVLITEFTYGFVVNSKEISFRVPALLLLGLYYMRGSINKKIVIFSLLIAIPYFLLFNAYRTQVLQGAINKTQTEALASFDKTVDTIIKSVSKIDDAATSSLLSLKNRINGKIYVDIIVAGTDSGKVERLRGESISLIFKTFIPRMFWPEKPLSSIGQRFNNEFGLSESEFTFVPVTGLGELYWNYGMTGVVIGMMVLGALFSLISAICLGGNITISRFLIVLLATYFLALRFEANFAVQYSKFLRLAILIFIMDFFIKQLGMRKAAS